MVKTITPLADLVAAARARIEEIETADALAMVDDPRVSHYRLTAHLSLAFLIFVAMFWLALGLAKRLRVLGRMSSRLKRQRGMIPDSGARRLSNVKTTKPRPIFTAAIVERTRLRLIFAPRKASKKYANWSPTRIF